MKKKHTYEININTVREKVETYKYKYGNIDNIELSVCEQGIKIAMEIGKKYTIDDIVGYGRYYIFPDAIKKALLVYLLKYSKEINIEQVNVSIDGESEPAVLKVHSLIKGELIGTIGESLKSRSMIESILSFTKTRQGKRFSALYAFLQSKTKESEVEKFIYLWMAFNGLYGYTGELVKKMKNEKENKNIIKIQENQQIGWFLALFELTNTRVTEKNNYIIAKKVIGILSDWDGLPITKDSLESGPHKSISDDIQEVIKETDNDLRNTSLGYLLGFFSYYFRCNIIHASKPIPLYSHEKEYEIKCLKIVNQILDTFINENLHLFFDNNYIDEILVNKIDEVLDNSEINMDRP